MSVPIQDTAFATYLRSLTRAEAAEHLYNCLSEGPQKENMAWELFEEAGGHKLLAAHGIEKALESMIDHLGAA